MTKELRRKITAWLLRVTGGKKVESIASLKGATSSSVYDVTIDAKEYVLRVYTNETWNRNEPDLAVHEAAALHLVDGIYVDTPECIAYDGDGRYTEHPVVLMTKIAGYVPVMAQDENSWFSALACALNTIHSIGNVPFEWKYDSYYDIETLRAPTWSPDGDVWERAITYTRDTKREDPLTVIHRDYHPLNVLWNGQKICGVVDWVNACIGPRGVDVGHCRLNLALLYGVEASDRFLKAYEKVAGDAFLYAPYWDLRMIFEFLPGPPGVYSGWSDVGITGLTDVMVKARYEAYFLSVWDRIHGASKKEQRR